MNLKYSIGLVDDHTLFRKGMIELINLIPNYQVLFDAGSGKECIDFIEKGKKPDIILLDIKMKELDGYETANWIKTHHPEILILALSTMDTEAAIIKMIRNGATGYVLKDGEPAELKKAFDEMILKGYYYNERLSHQVFNTLHALANGKKIEKSKDALTDREIHFLKLACTEKTYQEIASEMFVSPRTVDGYRESLFEKCNVTSRIGLVIYALKNEIVSL